MKGKQITSVDLAREIIEVHERYERLEDWRKTAVVVIAENTICSGRIPIKRVLTDKARDFLVECVERGDIEIVVDSLGIVAFWVGADRGATGGNLLFNGCDVTIETLQKRARQCGVDFEAE